MGSDDDALDRIGYRNPEDPFPGTSETPPDGSIFIFPNLSNAHPMLIRPSMAAVI